MEIRPARDSDLAEITSIFNHEVEHSAPIWVETPVTLADRRTWLAARQADAFPCWWPRLMGKCLALLHMEAAVRMKAFGRPWSI